MGWAPFYEYMKNSETLTPPSAELGVDFKWSSETYGANGSMRASIISCVYGSFLRHVAQTNFRCSLCSMVSQVGSRTPTWENLGLHALDKPNGGVTLGAFISPPWINPSNLTHSYAKSAYLDPVLCLTLDICTVFCYLLQSREGGLQFGSGACSIGVWRLGKGDPTLHSQACLEVVPLCP
jgi:hypothetical protein